MAEHKPDITILMASYNRLELLKAAVSSALEQDYDNYEVLVIDDGSDEQTCNWLREKEKQNAKLRTLFNEHQGVAAARATGVTEARGEWICILDSDDHLAKNALTELVKVVNNYPDVRIINTNIRELRPDNEVRIIEYPHFNNAEKMLWTVLLKPRVPFKHSGTFFHRQTAIELGSYSRDLPCKIDIDFYLKFLKAGYLPRLVETPLVDFRMHKDSISRNRKTGLKVWFYMIDQYGPGIPFARPLIKLLRVLSESAKFMYIELRG